MTDDARLEKLERLLAMKSKSAARALANLALANLEIVNLRHALSQAVPLLREQAGCCADNDFIDRLDALSRAETRTVKDT